MHLWFKNLGLRAKLMTAFSVLLLVIIPLLIFGLVSIRNINNYYSAVMVSTSSRLKILSELSLNFMRIERATTESIRTPAESATIAQQIQAYQTGISQLGTRYIQELEADSFLSEYQLAELTLEFQDIYSRITQDHASMVSDVLSSLSAGNMLAANAARNSMLAESSALEQSLTSFIQSYEGLILFHIDAVGQIRANLTLLLYFVASGFLICGFIVSSILSNNVVRSMRKLTDASLRIAAGDFTVQVGSNSRDEIGTISNSLRDIKVAVEGLTSDMLQVSKAFQGGDLDARINPSGLNGTYKVVAEEINALVDNIVKDMFQFLNCMNDFGNGNFDIRLPKMPGKKIVMNEIAENIRTNLSEVNEEISELVKAAISGNLSKKANAAAYKGDWAKILNRLNELLDIVSHPIHEVSVAMEQISRGNFTHTIQGEYHGDFLKIKTSVNTGLSSIESYIREISDVLQAVASNNLRSSITREYVGSFSDIKLAINNISATLNRIIGDINDAAENVSGGARHISQSTMMLASSSIEQVEAVDRINMSTKIITESLFESVARTKDAEALTAQSRNNAQRGDTEMNKMLQSMQSIKESSAKISNINKVIEDIAFQTNLLALNAAVEAARAGEHGKGFAVVAQEVRNLASRSQDAAKETSSLISESIQRVDEGTKSASETAEALHAITEDISSISDIIHGISQAAKDEADTVGEIAEGLAQLTTAAHGNSATSEQTASACQELSSQADVLYELVGVFQRA